MKKFSKAQQIRLKFIDAHIIERGTLSRQNITDMFCINTPTASRDLARYLEIGGKITFHPQRRQYERDYHFKSLYFTTPEKAAEFMAALRTVYGIISL